MQALFDGRTSFNKFHWSGSDNQRLCVSAYPAPEIRRTHYFIALP